MNTWNNTLALSVCHRNGFREPSDKTYKTCLLYTSIADPYPKNQDVADPYLKNQDNIKVSGSKNIILYNHHHQNHDDVIETVKKRIGYDLSLIHI